MLLFIRKGKLQNSTGKKKSIFIFFTFKIIDVYAKKPQYRIEQQS